VVINSIRDYQIEIFNNSYGKNRIIFLETGTGKTLVATMLIYYHFKKQRLAEKKKKIIFIANTVQLIEQ
jgi:ERCC4-related helicase